MCAAGSELVSSSSLNVNGFHNITGRLIDVQCTTLDAAIPADAAVDLVKIDVEGFEGSVIKGMKRIMTEYRPEIILEVSDETREDAQEFLTGAGYSLYHLRASGPAPVSRMVADTTFRNYLARHRCKIAKRG